jgi:hypothetical protein
VNYAGLSVVFFFLIVIFGEWPCSGSVSVLPLPWLPNGFAIVLLFLDALSEPALVPVGHVDFVYDYLCVLLCVGLLLSLCVWCNACHVIRKIFAAQPGILNVCLLSEMFSVEGFCAVSEVGVFGGSFCLSLINLGCVIKSEMK